MDEAALGIAYFLLARNQAGATTLNYDAGVGYNTGQVTYHAEDNHPIPGTRSAQYPAVALRS